VGAALVAAALGTAVLSGMLERRSEARLLAVPA
ncbi:MAG: hypothetical protein JWQ91_327, partial [Aeromicrobium sp.]|nr:hypothetical protein [Aeromicrobium sp.]